MNACSWWPDVILWINQTACCFRHDTAYDAQDPRLAADLDLFSCIAALDEHSALALCLAIIVFIGVRLFGGSFYRRARTGTMPLSPFDIQAITPIAESYKQPLAHVAAVIMTESDGVFFAPVDGLKMPLIRIEGHIFYRRLTGADREDAVKAGLASQRPGVVKNPKSQQARYDMLKRMMLINRQAALESVSWGCGQVMGFHWQTFGYTKVEELVDKAKSGLAGQVDLLLRYCVVNDLDDELRQGQWKPFARGYNGKGYAANRYDEKLANYAAQYGGANKPAEGMLRMGSTGARVRELQALLVRSGAALNVDGDFGQTTKAALRAFQKSAGVTDDGIYGPETERLLGTYRQASADIPGKRKFIDIGGVKRGIGIAAAAGVTATQVQDLKGMVEASATQLAATGIQSALLDYASNGLTLVAWGLGCVGLVLVVKGWVTEKQTVEA